MAITERCGSPSSVSHVWTEYRGWPAETSPAWKHVAPRIRSALTSAGNQRFFGTVEVFRAIRRRVKLICVLRPGAPSHRAEAAVPAGVFLQRGEELGFAKIRPELRR